SRWLLTAPSIISIVRITGDNPLIDPEIIDGAVKSHLDSGADYSSTYLVKQLPLGLGTEVFYFDALKKAFHGAQSAEEKEHVTPYFYKNPHLFKIHPIRFDESFTFPKAHV